MGDASCHCLRSNISGNLMRAVRHQQIYIVRGRSGITKLGSYEQPSHKGDFASTGGSSFGLTVLLPRQAVGEEVFLSYVYVPSDKLSSEKCWQTHLLVQRYLGPMVVTVRQVIRPAVRPLTLRPLDPFGRWQFLLRRRRRLFERRRRANLRRSFFECLVSRTSCSWYRRWMDWESRIRGVDGAR